MTTGKRKKHAIEEELRAARDELEQRVQERTRELSARTIELEAAYEALATHQEELRQQNEALLAARQEVEAERQRYQELFELAPDGYLVTGLNGEIHEANRAAARMLGVRQDTLAGKPLLVYVPRPEHPAFYEQLAWLRQGELDEVRGWRTRLRPWRRAVRDVLITVTSIRDSSGARTGLRWLIHDVGEQMQAEQERECLLQENRRQREVLEQLMEAVPAGIAVVGAKDHRYQYANSCYAGIPGMLATQVVGRTLQEVLPDGVAEEVERAVDRVRQKGEPASARAGRIVMGPAQQETYWNTDYVPLHGSEGEVDRVLMLVVDVTDHVQARRRVEELAARDEAVLDSMAEALILFDLQGRVVEVNPASLRLHGAERSQMVGHSTDDMALLLEVRDMEGRLVPQEEWPPERVRHGEHFTGLDLHVQRRDTGRAWVGSYSGTLVYGREGTPILGLLTIRDITARKEAEARARRYAERLRLLHETDEAILSSHSAEEVAQAVLHRLPGLLPCWRASVVQLDTEAGEMSVLAAYSAGETELSRGWREPLSEIWARMAPTLAEGREYVIEDVQELPPLSLMVKQLQAEGVRGIVMEPLLIQGKLVGSLNVGLDVPGSLPPEQVEVMRELADPLAIGLEQARLYEEVQQYAGELERLVQRRTAALEASEARFRAVFEEAAIGIALVNSEGYIVSSNPALQRILGYGREELEGKSCLDLLAPDGKQESIALFDELVAGQRDAYWLEQRLLHEDGRTIDTNLTMSLVRRGRGRPSFVLVLVEDVSERKQAQQALIQSERLAIAGRLAASIAHEVNNPLQSVTGSLELVNELLQGGEDPSSFMQVALEELERASRIVHQMRDLGRREQAQKEPVDVNELVDKVLLLTHKQAQTHQVEVAWEAGEGLPLISMVRDRIQQVFLNLVLNAVDAMPEGGDLRIRTTLTENPDGVLIAFVDTGVGISPERLEHLFEPFRSTKPQGMGLGLYVSRNIVQEHGGWIEVESEVGRGSTFIVWLPGEGTSE